MLYCRVRGCHVCVVYIFLRNSKRRGKECVGITSAESCASTASSLYETRVILFFLRLAFIW